VICALPKSHTAWNFFGESMAMLRLGIAAIACLVAVEQLIATSMTSQLGRIGDRVIAPC
jgi:hypothetical protein